MCEKTTLLLERHYLNAVAKLMRQMVDGLELEELGQKLGESGWSLKESRLGIELLKWDGDYVIQIFLGMMNGVTIRRWKREVGGQLPPQKTSWDTSISIYPGYHGVGSPVFDDLRQIDSDSRMSYLEAKQLLQEVVEMINV